jgi:division protein CdvB (Snf7/Vps24/ESCRT-III family)
MSHRSETPFDNIESSHEYISMLAEAIDVALAEAEADLALAGADQADRRREAIQLVLFKMNKLKGHMTSSRRILNDLRTLRRLLLEERSLTKVHRQSAE